MTQEFDAVSPQEFDAVLSTLDFLENEINELKGRVEDLELDKRYLESDIEDLNDRLYKLEGVDE